MSQYEEDFLLPDATPVRTGLLPQTAEDEALVAAAPMYGEEFYLEDKDIQKLLANDTYKTWRRVRSKWVLQQGRLGSCNCAATIGACHNRRHLDGLAHIPLSVNYLYMHINGGRDQGSTLAAGIEFAKKGMAPIELSRDGEKWKFPLTVYNTRQVPQNWLKIAREESTTFQSFEAYKLPVGNYTMFKRAVASALARDHQIVHAWHVGRNSMSLRNGYIVVGRGSGNHATLAHSGKWVGGEDLVHPDVQGSWGPSKDPIYGPTGSGFGDDGFGLMTMRDFYACSGAHAYWVFVGNKMNKDAIK